MSEILPHLPDTVYDVTDFCLMLYKILFSLMDPKEKDKYTGIIAMIDYGVPLQNHYGRVKFLRFLTGIIVGYQR